MSQYHHSFAEEARTKFEYLWRDKLIHVPPLDKMPREQYDQLKEWAWEVFKQIHNVELR